jgi:hypothetical protein
MCVTLINAKDTYYAKTIAKKVSSITSPLQLRLWAINNNPIHIFPSSQSHYRKQQHLVTMSDPTIEPKEPSNDVLEFFYFSSTDTTPSTEATTTSEATTTTTTEATTSTVQTTTTENPVTTTSSTIQTTTTEDPVTTTTSTVQITTEVTETTTEVAETTTEATSTTTEAETTTVPPQMTKEVVVDIEETVHSEETVDPEETIDWSTFADEIEKKIEEIDGKDESSNKSKSYFSCPSPAAADDGTISPPGKPIVLRYDYDLTTIADLNYSTLSGFEDGITKNLADIHGLTACKRRYLRGLETGVVILALDSKPADVSVADTSECAAQEIDTTSSTFSCTPIRGSMTAYVEPDSDVEAAKAKILSHIRDGMASGAYNDDNVIKATYVGSRPVIVAGDTVDVPAIDMAGDVVDVPIVNDIVPDANAPVINEIKGLPLRVKEPPTLAIGISVFLVGFAALVLVYAFFMYRRKKATKEPSDESTQQPVDAKNVPDIQKVESAESTVDLTEKEIHDLSDHKYGNAIASNTLSSSGDEDDLHYGMTEDYGDLANHFSTEQDVTQVHPESCLAVINSGSDLEARSFETVTPITTPITSPVSSPRTLLPAVLSPATSHFSTGQDVNQVHPESCLAVFNSGSDLEAGYFETGTPITTPITSPVSSPRTLLPAVLSPTTSHFSTEQDVTQAHPESCLAVFNSGSDLEARSFETVTPITTPITSPVSSPRNLLPAVLSPATSVEEDLLADIDDVGGTTLDSIPI